MAISYIKQVFVNDSAPYLSATELNKITDTLEALVIQANATVPLAKGGTGATTAAAARTALGVAATTHAHGAVTSDGKIGTAANKAIYTGEAGVVAAGILPIAAGGTNASTAANARTQLGAQKAITSGTAAPSGGSNGDIYLKYEA